MAPGGTVALELVKDDRASLNLDLAADVGMFHSEESYAQVRTDSGSVSWQEAFGSVGLSGSIAVGGASEMYGNLSLTISATWGDGDAAGFSTGDETTTDIENGYLGWRSGTLWPALGKNGVDISAGRQNYKIGSGFLIDGDALNFGKGFNNSIGPGALPGSVNRGGAYYLGPRNAFDETAILRVGQETLRGEFFWLQSDNKAQSETELAGVNLMLVDEALGNFGFAWLHGLDVEQGFADFFGQTRRDDQDTFSLRYDGSAGVKNLSLSAEYAWQDNGGDGNEQAGFVEAGWTFADAKWTPGIGARYATFSSGFDPLFYGFSTNYGTWFQGEVAGNYAGPFNTNATIWHVFASAQPRPNVLLGLLYFHFDPRRDSLGNLGGDEVNLYAEWTVNEHLMLSPLLGVYKPDKSAGNGGSQLGGTDTNLYLQVTATIIF